ncbi:MAG: alpha/beta hydrolase [Rubrivivax sp.]
MNRRHSPAWHDAQYNNRARIPEHPQILQSWAERSALALSSPGCICDVPYLELAHGKHLAPAEAGHMLDIFLPPADAASAANRGIAAEGAPVLVYLHGGYWRALSKRDQAFVAPPFAAAGALVVVPDYPLAPKVSVEQIVLQVGQALDWTWRHARAYGGNPDRLIVAGHSAGGHLAAMMLALQWPLLSPDLPADLVKGAVSLSGVFEVEPLRHAPFLAPDLGLDEGRAHRLSPAEMPAPAGPLIALVGAQESEEFLRQNRLIRKRWGAKAVPVCETVPGRHHMNVLHDLADPEARAHLLTLELLGLRKTR